jgi:pSer/pThr/pTyr-binding forkhead associated (FHA) protein
MLKCPNCGYENEDFADECGICQEVLVMERKMHPSTPRVAPPPEPEPDEIIYPPLPSGARPMRLIVENCGLTLDVPKTKKEIVIGREDAENGIFPDIDTTTFGGNQEGVSRKHAQIILKGNQYFIEDLNSMNNTYVNKIKVAANQLFPLNDDDIITLGHLNLRVNLLKM